MSAATTRVLPRGPAQWAGWYLLGVLVLVVIAGEAAYLAFGWPDFLRRPPEEVLAILHERVEWVFVSYYLWVIAWLAFVAVPVLVFRVASRQASLLALVAIPFGCLAGLCHALGPARWVFVVPDLAADFHSEEASQATRDAILVVFHAIHQFGGVAIGEHVGNLLRGAWTALVSLSLVESLPRSLRVVGMVAAAGAVVVSLEQLGGPFAGLLSLLAGLQFVWFLWGVMLAIALLRSPRAGESVDA